MQNHLLSGSNDSKYQEPFNTHEGIEVVGEVYWYNISDDASICPWTESYSVVSWVRIMKMLAITNAINYEIYDDTN